MYKFLISKEMFKKLSIDRASSQLLIIQILYHKSIISQIFSDLKWTKSQIIELTMLPPILSSDIPS